MDSEGRFHDVEKNGKLFLEYYHLKYHPIQNFSNEAMSNNENGLQPLFLCPIVRWRSEYYSHRGRSFSPPVSFPLKSSPEYKTFSSHHLHPLFWCNNKEFDVNGGCNICEGSNYGTDYYICEYCEIFHKECVESPSKIKHPYHPQHILQLHFHSSEIGISKECFCCGKIALGLVYYCVTCSIFMHTICAMKSILLVIDPPKRHNHPLTFFPRQTSLTCNICGLLRNLYPTYVCFRCNFVAHNDCMYSPNIIKMSRHTHRISYVSSIPSGKWLCGGCRQSINGDYGAYTCGKCSDYVAHVRCALRKDVWDGEDLEGIPEEDDTTQDVGPFNMITKGVILHFLHDHHLQLEVTIFYDENKLCQACVLPIFQGNFYSCMECEYILHETCAKAPRIIQHVLHPHRLTLKAYNGLASDCDACHRVIYGGFIYGCWECNFALDVRCASISEPFDYKIHKHPLFLALDPKEQPICHVCKTKCHKQINCIECDFIVCIKCATLPEKARYKHDKHFLRVLCEEEVCENSWCEVCERNLKDTNTKVFYWCDECCVTFHIECLLDEDPYVRHGQSFELNAYKIHILRKSNLSRPLCDNCKNPCQGKIFKTDKNIICSLKCTCEMFL